ncbi:MAG: FAD-dependent oxidoreductase [Victivallales bacterium]|nr:FAD-dependent oxidoreductase [Victivallales bacterium]
MRYDVIVAGFGTAGSIAAVAAARQGMKVLVLEKNTYGGGTHTGGHICGYFDGEPHGLTRELNKLTKDMIQDSGYLHPEAPQEIKIIVYEQEILKHGGDIAYEACVTDVLMDGKEFKGVVWYDVDGRHEADGGILIDGSADATFCAMAGCELVRGRASDGLFQNFTNSSAYLYPDMHVWTANPDAGRMDQTDAEEFSRMMLKTATVHLRDHYSDTPERLIKACDLPGLREGPRIVPETLVRMDDFINDSMDHSEVIAWTKVFFDNHSNDYALEDELYQDWVFTGMHEERVWFGLPRGAIIPRGFKGILVAGRHLGVDHDMGFPLRMNGLLSRAGEAAGVLAALAVKLKMAPQEVPYQELENIIHTGSAPENMNHQIRNLSDDEIVKGLASRRPGRAIWSAINRKRPELLKQVMVDNAPGSDAFCHAAIALALMNDTSVLPAIRLMAQNRDPEVSLCTPRHGHARGYVAVYLLGRFRDVESIGLFENILAEHDMPHKFYYHSNAMMALFKIGDAHPGLRERIAKIILPIVENSSWHLEARLGRGMKRTDPLLRINAAIILRRWNIPSRISAVLSEMELEVNERNLAKHVAY